MSRDKYPFDEKEHKARLLIGDPQAEAYAWIEAYAKQITKTANEDDEYGSNADYSADDLIDIALSHSSGKWGDYICHGGAFEGVGVDPLFWDKLAIALDREVADEDRQGFFSCSC